MPNANIDLVTAHTGQPHITTQNVVDLIGGLSGITNKVRRLKTPQEGLILTHSGMTVTISAGAGIAGGYFFELGENYSVTLDPGRNGYTRKDRIFVVIYENPQTNIQSCDFVYVTGTEASNGSNAAEPSAPTGANISKTFVFADITIKDNAVLRITSSVFAHYDNEGISEKANGLQQSVNYLQSQINDMKQSFTDGCNTITDALGAYGITPDSTHEFPSPQEISSAIGSVYTLGRNQTDGALLLNETFSCEKTGNSTTVHMRVEAYAPYDLGMNDPLVYINVDLERASAGSFYEFDQTKRINRTLELNSGTGGPAFVEDGDSSIDYLANACISYGASVPDKHGDHYIPSDVVEGISNVYKVGRLDFQGSVDYDLQVVAKCTNSDFSYSVKLSPHGVSGHTTVVDIDGFELSGSVPAPSTYAVFSKGYNIEKEELYFLG